MKYLQSLTMNQNLGPILKSTFLTINSLLSRYHCHFRSKFQVGMEGNKVIGLFLVILLFIPTLSTAQKTKGELEQEKKENLRKIAEAERILDETASQKQVTLGQLQALNQQIKARQSLINSIASEIKILDGEISDLSIVVSALQNDLKNLKQEYADQIYASYKSNKGNSRLMFLFSAKNFNQLIQRDEIS